MKREAFRHHTNDVLQLVLMKLKWWCFGTETVDFSNQDTGTPSESRRRHGGVAFLSVNAIQGRKNVSVANHQFVQLSQSYTLLLFISTQPSRVFNKRL